MLLRILYKRCTFTVFNEKNLHIHGPAHSSKPWFPRSIVISPCIRVVFLHVLTQSGTVRLPPLFLHRLIITIIICLSDNYKRANYCVYLGILIIYKLSTSFLLFLFQTLILISLSALYMWNHTVLCVCACARMTSLFHSARWSKCQFPSF